MPLRITGQFRSPDRSGSFNMTPVIDIVFLLIIFFLVVCQFIEAENFPVAVPDGCQFAEDDTEHQGQITTLTVMKSAEGEVDFAIGPEKINASGCPETVETIAELIDVRLKGLPPKSRVVILRIDKDIYFADAQYALAAVAASIATDIQLAALKDKRTGPQ